MRPIWHLISLGSLCIATPALAGELQSFDLQCSIDAVPAKLYDRSDRLRIDIASKQWCDGDCEKTSVLVLASANQLRLADNADGGLLGVVKSLVFDPVRNILDITTIWPDGHKSLVSKNCRRDEFSGFVKTYSSPAFPYPGALNFGLSLLEAKDRKGFRGSTRFEAAIDGSGKVISCRVMLSSGVSDLDQLSCDRVLQARFGPARDDQGSPVPSTYSRTIRWVF